MPLFVFFTTWYFYSVVVGKYTTYHVMEEYSQSYAGYVATVAAIVIMFVGIIMMYLNWNKPSPSVTAVPNPETNGHHCPYCGHAIAEEEDASGKFCRNCGARLK